MAVHVSRAPLESHAGSVHTSSVHPLIRGDGSHGSMRGSTLTFSLT